MKPAEVHKIVHIRTPAGTPNLFRTFLGLNLAVFVQTISASCPVRSVNDCKGIWVVGRCLDQSVKVVSSMHFLCNIQHLGTLGTFKLSRSWDDDSPLNKLVV